MSLDLLQISTREHDQPTLAQLHRGGRPPPPETRNLVLLDRSLKLVSRFPHQSVMRLLVLTIMKFVELAEAAAYPEDTSAAQLRSSVREHRIDMLVD